MLPPITAQLASRVKAERSLTHRYCDVTVAVLDGVIAETTALAENAAALEAKLLASYEAYDRLAALAGRVEFDASESALPETQEAWIEFIRELQDAREALVHPMDAELAATTTETGR